MGEVNDTPPDDSVAADDGPAIGDTQSRAALRRRLLTAAWTTAVGLTLLVGFAVAVTIVSDTSQRLREHGVSTSGTVVRLRDDTGRSSGSADISYTAGGTLRTGKQDLGANVQRYRVGQRVTVHYDAQDPNRFTIDSEDNQPGWTVPVMIALLLGGVAGLPSGVLRLFDWWRDRRVLSRHPWQPAWLEICTARTRTGRALCLVRPQDQPGVDDAQLFVASVRVGNLLPALVAAPFVAPIMDDLPFRSGEWTGLRRGEVRFAGSDGRRAVIAAPDPSSAAGWHDGRIRTFGLKAPRSDAQLARWSRRARS